MKQNERSIVRKRTQQLVYLELGRDNGGVMLNLSEVGCGFQAISPVKLGKVRFAFQISGGRRIAGEADVEWVDEAGIMGGLRFADLHADARKEIRRWLDDTNAPEEPGEGVVPAAASPLDAVAQGSRTASSREASASSMPPRDYRRNSSHSTGARVMEAEVPPATPWMNVPLYNLPILEEERARFPLLRGEASHRRSAALWRGIAGLATVVALGALVVTHQQEVGSSLIWIGETLAGKTNTSVVLPETKSVQPAGPAPDTQSAAGKPEEAKPEEVRPDRAGVTPENAQAVPRSEEQAAVQSDAVMKTTQRPESVLEQQPARQKLEPRIEGESVESLWGAVQGGSVAAEMSLAERFVHGDGVSRNCDQARVLMRAAANKGNREARLRLYELESGACR
jgi:hypothetical protein